ncbi:MAG: tRNA pseudouridine(38-40) synthase TruA [Sedimentisphaerales bacterium]|nr:tRNA pseudouridine(38-40) synthase TruA [Sedimentisphaerales bacterium]
MSLHGMALRNVKLTIAYDGSDYHGWQIQPGFRTVQEVLRDALRDLLGPRARVCGASRTDAGVSALGQVGLIQIDSPIPTENLAKAITDRLPEDMAVVKAEEVPMGFDVIGDVKSKLYRYTIFCGPVRPVLHMRHCWYVAARLDVRAMSEAAALLVGKKDFKSFAAAADHRDDSIRTIFRCDVTDRAADDGRWVYVDVEGDGFLYNMVRNIVGTLVEVGVGRSRPEKVSEILEARDRRAAGPIAPPNGLCLMWIQYD